MWYAALLALGLFSGIFTIAWVGGRTFASHLWLSQIVVGSCVVGLLVPTRLYMKRFGFERAEVFLFNVLFLGPVLAGGFLASNYLIVTEKHEETHRIESYNLKVDAYAGRILTFRLANDTFNNQPGMRRLELVNEAEYYEAQRAIAFRYTIATGWMGKKVLRESVVLYP